MRLLPKKRGYLCGFEIIITSRSLQVSLNTCRLINNICLELFPVSTSRGGGRNFCRGYRLWGCIFLWVRHITPHPLPLTPELPVNTTTAHSKRCPVPCGIQIGGGAYKDFAMGPLSGGVAAPTANTSPPPRAPTSSCSTGRNYL